MLVLLIPLLLLGDTALIVIAIQVLVIIRLVQ